eukprot:Hpha_TRINITY_DN16647_c0_g2::TRINITY_DN16647_c0_g2_i1::g.181384::m.181384
MMEDNSEALPEASRAGAGSETPGLSEEASTVHTPVPPPGAAPAQRQRHPVPPRPHSTPPTTNALEDEQKTGGFDPQPPRPATAMRSGEESPRKPRRTSVLFSEGTDEDADNRFVEGEEGEKAAAAAIQRNFRRVSGAMHERTARRQSSAAMIQTKWKERQDKRTPVRSQSFAYTTAARRMMVDDSTDFGKAYALARRSSVQLEEFLPDARRHLSVTKASDFSVAATTAMRVRRQSAKMLAITGRAAACGSGDFGRRASMRLIKQNSDEPWWRRRVERSLEERQLRVARDEEGALEVPAGSYGSTAGLPSIVPVNSPDYSQLLRDQATGMADLDENYGKYQQMMEHFSNITKQTHDRLDRICAVIDAWAPRLKAQEGAPEWWAPNPPQAPAPVAAVPESSNDPLPDDPLPQEDAPEAPVSARGPEPPRDTLPEEGRRPHSAR